MLSFLAGQTTRTRLGASVMIVPHRNPLVAAKSLATLDVLSGGRLILGVGVGWLREEFEVLGLPPFEERGEVTDDSVDVKAAVAIAREYVHDLFNGEEITNVGLEEVEYDEVSRNWDITIGFSRPWDQKSTLSATFGQVTLGRSYKLIRVHDLTGPRRVTEGPAIGRSQIADDRCRAPRSRFHGYPDCHGGP